VDQQPLTTHHQPPAVSVVVPVYRSEQTLEELVTRLRTALAPESGLEIILVNDGSPDRSWDVVQRLAARHADVHGIALSRNHGQHNALLCGLREASGEILVTIDDDLQNRPEDVPALLARLREGNDVVYGVPRRKQWGLMRNLASHVTKLVLQRAMGARTAASISGFRAIRAEVRQAFAAYSARFVNIDVLLTWGASRFDTVLVDQEPRRVGRSNYTFRRLVKHTFDMVTGFSTLPLQLATATGFLFTLFGIAVLIYVVGRYMVQGVAVPGFAFLASIIAIFSGAQLFALGIFGEYLARMFDRSTGQPSYTVRERTGEGTRHQAQGARPNHKSPIANHKSESVL
jgi:undecaprenyl-phosphate 4-deoxy-4-formamido-L-arabinose transferase